MADRRDVYNRRSRVDSAVDSAQSGRATAPPGMPPAQADKLRQFYNEIVPLRMKHKPKAAK